MTQLQQLSCENPKLLNPLVLAYMGDAVFELMVRERLVITSSKPVNQLHRMTVAHVCASAQSEAIEQLLDKLTEEEIELYKRGRNANGNHVPKNADMQEYRRATGFETLFGYLYLKGQLDRVKELFAIIWKEDA